MTYFSYFPTIVYPLTEDGETFTAYTVLDIMNRAVFNMTDAQMMAMTEAYTVTDGETLESISYSLYDTPYFHWTIMYVNNIMDYLTDWYMTQEQLDQYCIDKYGEDRVNNIIGYVDDWNNFVKAGPELNTFNNRTDVFTNVPYLGNVSQMTYKQYESALNDKKRDIRVIKKEYIGTFVNLVKNTVGGN